MIADNSTYSLVHQICPTVIRASRNLLQIISIKASSTILYDNPYLNMGKSAKAKKEKKKDFQKTKLKVGKTKPKASNVTDASFRAKCRLLSPI